HRDRVEQPGLGVLLAAAALVVPAPADHAPVHRVVAERRLIAHPRRRRRALDRAALDPGVRLLLQHRRISQHERGDKQCCSDDKEEATHGNHPSPFFTAEIAETAENRTPEACETLAIIYGVDLTLGTV